MFKRLDKLLRVKFMTKGESLIVNFSKFTITLLKVKVLHDATVEPFF